MTLTATGIGAVVRHPLRLLNYKMKRHLLVRSIAAADRHADEWALRAILADYEHGSDSEHARHADQRLRYFTGVLDRATTLLTRLEAEDKP